MHKIDLPNGKEATIREPEEVPERLRRAYLEAQSDMLKGSGAVVSDEGVVDKESLDVAMMGRLVGPVRDALILAYTKSWTLTDEENGPLALNLEAIMDLPGGVYDALHTECERVYKEGKGGVVDVTPAGALDPASPIVPLAE